MSTFAALGGKIDQEGGFKFLAQMFRQGYVLGMNVTQRGAGANMSVDINVDATTSMAGANFLTSANVPYYGWSDATANLVISTSDPANPRLDVVVAYIDLSLITSTVTNNNGALKFKDVTGTPAGGPTAPNSAAIQSSVGAGNPWVSLGQLAVAANAPSIVTANITDTRLPAAYRGGYLYGGASNTKGHLVPNQADGTVVTTSDTNSVSGQMLATNAMTLGYAQITSPFINNTNGAYVDVTGLSVAVTVPAGGRKVKITATVPYLSTAVGSPPAFRYAIFEGATALAGDSDKQALAGNNNPWPPTVAVVTPSAGAHTYKVSFRCNQNSNLTASCSATDPAFILVELI